jgi:protein-disulfide isomerase
MDNHHNHNIVYIAIAASTIISLVGNYFMIQQPQIEQFGGRANYATFREIAGSQKYTEYQKKNLENMKAAINGEQPQAPANNQPAEEKTTGNLTQDDIAAVMKDTYLRGNKDATILWVEYSDLECPFCKRLHDTGAIKNLETKYGSKMAFVFKHYPLPFHSSAMPAALTAECVGELGGSTKYYAFIEGVFSKGVPTQDLMDGVLKDIGVDAKKVKSCVDSGKFKDKINASQSEGSSKFSVNGTPGNVLINTKTGKYEVVSGAQPEANFDAAITRLLAE